MEISSKYVGIALKEYRMAVNWRATMNYAAAVEDRNPRYFDDERESGVVAPPMYSVAATWPIIERLWDYIAADDFPMEVLRTQVHDSEHLEFHASIKPGDELRIRGVIAAIWPGRSGTRLVIRFEAADPAGKPIFTEHIGGMLRGVTCADSGAGKESLPAVPQAPQAAAPVWEQDIHIDPLRPYIYDGCADIFFPIHTSRKFAHAVGLPGVILQGTATLAFAARELLNRNARGEPDRLQSLGCRFTGMIFPGTDIRVQLLNLQDNGRHRDLFFRVLDARGRTAVDDGYARVRS